MALHHLVSNYNNGHNYIKKLVAHEIMEIIFNNSSGSIRMAQINRTSDVMTLKHLEITPKYDMTIDEFKSMFKNATIELIVKMSKN